MSIRTENAKNIRAPMQVEIDLAARALDANGANILLTPAVTGAAAQDSNLKDAINSPEWGMRGVADLCGGFPADGSRELLDTSEAASADNQKLGIQSAVGGSMTITVTAAVEVAAVTVVFYRGSGTITCGNYSSDIHGVNVIPVNAKTATLTITAAAGERVLISSITPGISITLDNGNLTSAVVELRSETTAINPTWQVSEIEASAYWPDDITEAISNLPDDVPIRYRAGYSGDMSEWRSFYLSEEATMADNIITIKGQDASAKLDDVTIEQQIIRSNTKRSRYDLYQKMRALIQSCGIKFATGQVQAPPPTYSITGAQSDVILNSVAVRDHVQNIMNTAHSGNFWPTFVDAGRPRLTWSKPTAKWTIYERDCGEITKGVERNIAKINSNDSEHGLLTTVKAAAKWTKILNGISVKADSSDTKKGAQPTTKSFEDYYYAYKPGSSKLNSHGTNLKKINFETMQSFSFWPWQSTYCRKIKKKYVYKGVKRKNGRLTKAYKKWLAKHKGKNAYHYIYEKDKNGKKIMRSTFTLYGKKATITTTSWSVIAPTKRPGQTISADLMTYGGLDAYDGTSTARAFPSWASLFKRSNVTWEFTWKGDPHMQPRDVVSWVRLDGSTLICTIDSIELTHEGGGTTAKIKMREGIV